MAQSAGMRRPWVPTCSRPPATRGPADQRVTMDDQPGCSKAYETDKGLTRHTKTSGKSHFDSAGLAY